MDDKEILLAILVVLVAMLSVCAISMALATAHMYGVSIDIQAEADRLTEFVRTYWWMFAIGFVCSAPIYLYSRWVEYRQNEAMMRLAEQSVTKWMEENKLGELE